MNYRKILKQVLPPLVTDLMRREVARANPIWEGIFPNLEAVTGVTRAYDVPTEVGNHLEVARTALETVKAGNKIRVHHEALGVVAGQIYAQRGAVKVLDFGGSTGLGFVHLLDTLPDTGKVEYHVVDLKGMCEAGRTLFHGDPRIHFHETLPALATPPDLVYLRGILPYISDYRTLLKQMAGLKSGYVLMAQLAAGKIPTYAARQVNLPNVKLPYWFINIDEIISLMGDCGYNVQYNGWEESKHHQENYPETHRIGRMRTVLFTNRNLGPGNQKINQ